MCWLITIIIIRIVLECGATNNSYVLKLSMMESCSTINEEKNRKSLSI